MSKFHDEFFKKGSAKHDKLFEQTLMTRFVPVPRLMLEYKALVETKETVGGLR